MQALGYDLSLTSIRHSLNEFDLKMAEKIMQQLETQKKPTKPLHQVFQRENSNQTKAKIMQCILLNLERKKVKLRRKKKYLKTKNPGTQNGQDADFGISRRVETGVHQMQNLINVNETLQIYGGAQRRAGRGSQQKETRLQDNHMHNSSHDYDNEGKERFRSHSHRRSKQNHSNRSSRKIDFKNSQNIDSKDKPMWNSLFYSTAQKNAKLFIAKSDTPPTPKKVTFRKEGLEEIKIFDAKRQNRLLNLSDRKLGKLQRFDLVNGSDRRQQLLNHFESSLMEPTLENIELLRSKNQERKQLIQGIMDQHKRDSAGNNHDNLEKEGHNTTDNRVKFSSKKNSHSHNKENANSRNRNPNPNNPPISQKDLQHKRQFLKYLKAKVNYKDPQHTVIEQSLLESNKLRKLKEQELLNLKALYDRDLTQANITPALRKLITDTRKWPYKRKSKAEQADVKLRAQFKFSSIHKVVLRPDIFEELRLVFDDLDQNLTKVVPVKKLVTAIKKHTLLKKEMGRAVISFRDIGSADLDERRYDTKLKKFIGSKFTFRL